MRIGVLGGGLQGACVALELAAQGVEVDLYERDDRCLSRASRHNEGKIHLGYVYANDATRRTARTMAMGARCFQPLMRRWIGAAIDSIPVSAPFHYVVHRRSMLGLAEVEEHFAATQQILAEENEGLPMEYFGCDYREQPSRLSEAECARHFAPDSILAAYRTPEIAIDSEALANAVRAHLTSAPNIRCRVQTVVGAVDPRSESVTVFSEKAGAPAREEYEHVVNTAWDGRLAIDQTAGVKAPRPWLYRMKYFLRLRSPGNGATLPTTTIVLGPFGDVVRFPNGETFLSWYPAGMTDVSSEIAPPAWPLALEPEAAAAMRENILSGLAAVIPGAGELPADLTNACRVKAGVIVAWGSTDIPDRESGLHERFAIGPVSYGRYHTIDTGKLTLAPYFGKLAADRILGKEFHGR